MAITRVSGQHASFTQATNTSASVTFTNNPANGNLVVVGISLHSTGLTIVVKDANNNVYTATTSTPITGAGFMSGIWYLVAPSNASKTINITWGGSSIAAIAAAQEYAGAATSLVLENDATTVASGSGTTINTPSITTTNDGDLLFAVVNNGQGFNITAANSPWTAVDVIQTLSSCEDLIQTSKGAQAVNFTQAGSSPWNTVEAAFKAPAGVATETMMPMISM